MPIVTDIFGHTSDPSTGQAIPVKRYTLSTQKSGVKVQVISLGAAISDVQCPDKNGTVDRVVLSFDCPDGYSKFNYIGTTIGRTSNRIAKGRFKIGEQEFLLSINNNGNHLHGGIKGWNKYNWESFTHEDNVIFSLVSPNGDEGYPGSVLAQVTYSLAEDGSLKIQYEATVTNRTPIDMTNHSFFNLGGFSAGQKGVFDTSMQILADNYLPVMEDMIPTGEIAPVANTLFDLREPKMLAETLTGNSGIDHCFCIRNKQKGVLELAAKAHHIPSGRTLAVYTTQPGVQFYTGNFMPKDIGVMVGRQQVSYTYQGAFCLEPENFPNAVNEPSFPAAITYPGETYKHTLVYQFGVHK